MKKIDDIIVNIINNKQLQKEMLQKCRNGEGFDIFDISVFQKEQPYIISEKTFETLINFAKKRKRNNEIFENMEPFISNKTNISDSIFEQLLDFAKENEWIYLGLCHAGLDDKKVAKLKSLNLDESLWY